MVLAGGEGKRLQPLTADRAKPAVPFGGNFRLVDFALSNLVNAGFLRIAVLTQYKSHSLDRHIATTWRLSPLLGNYVTPVPAQMRRGPRWFAGSADAIYQNINLISDERPDYICVFGADHIYRMDPRQMIEQHLETGAGVTVAGIRVPIEQASEFGVMETGADGKTISAFREKPSDPVGLSDAPDQVFASMGNYVFTTRTLVEAVTLDAADETSRHDLGGDIIPGLVERDEAYVWDFAENNVPGVSDRERSYWRDVGTLDAYFEAHMDLISLDPVFNLYNEAWPILTAPEPLPPAKFVLEEPGRTGMAVDSMVCAGVVVSGGVVRRSILSPRVHVHSYAEVEDCVLMHEVDIGRSAVIRRGDPGQERPRRRGSVRSASIRRPTRSGSRSQTRVSSWSARGRRLTPDAGALRVALLTREYPPDVYGGAGVHVEYLARELARLVDVTVHCWGDDRPAGSPGEPQVVAHRAWDALRGASPHLAALQAMSIDLTMAAGVEGSTLVHSHTWYAQLRRPPRQADPRDPARRDGAFAGADASMEGGAARRRLRGLELLRASRRSRRRTRSWRSRRRCADDVLARYPAIDPARVHVIYNGIDARGVHA